MSADTEAARQWLIARRDILQGRITELNNLLAELDTTIVVVPVVERKVVHRNKSKLKRDAVQQALVARGAAGLTIEEGAKITGFPPGTISSALSKLKSTGLATHKMPRYWAVDTFQPKEPRDHLAEEKP